MQKVWGHLHSDSRKLSRSPSAWEDWELAMEEKTVTTPKRNPARSLASTRGAS